MTSDERPSSPMPPEDSSEPFEDTEEDIEDLEALRRIQNREVAVIAALRLLGPLLVIGILVAIGWFTYTQIAELRARARAEIDKNPVEAMESLMREDRKKH